MAATGVANSRSFTITTPTEDSIVLTRLFDAPPHIVFEAMTRPEHIRNWWGRLGEGYSVPVCEVDLRVGGKWRFVNRHPNGEAAFYGEYREVAAPHRLVFTETMEPYPAPGSVVTAEYTEEHGKTRLTATVVHPSKDVRDIVMASGMDRGAAISYDRLEEVASALAAA